MGAVRGEPASHISSATQHVVTGPQQTDAVAPLSYTTRADISVQIGNVILVLFKAEAAA